MDKKQMDGWMDRKNIDGWLNGYTFFKEMDGQENIEARLDGQTNGWQDGYLKIWLDGQENIK